MNAEDVVNDIKTSMTQRKVRRFSEPGRGRRVRCPEEILRDIRGLKLRQRVSLVLSDDLLKDELEQTIRNSTINGVTRADTIRTYQDFLLPQAQPNFAHIGGGNVGGHGMAVLPVNDIKGNDTLQFSKIERQMRNKLAAVYRLVDLLGWSESIYNHISVRVSHEQDEYLINPFGLLFSEITASSLMKCDLQGNVIDSGSTNLGLNKAGFILHSTIHEFRPDLNCIIHVHTPDVVAISSMKCGFLRISQESLIVGDVSYHDYFGILVNEEEKESIRNDLGPVNKIMFLRNHGAVICGNTIEQTFHSLLNLMDACAAQVKAMVVGVDNLNIISDEAFEQVQEIVRNNSKVNIASEGKPQLGLDEITFEAYMRWMDSQGYRTGYAYRMPDLFISSQVKKFPESQIPPQVTSDRVNPYQAYYDSPAASYGRGNTYLNRAKWLMNNPKQGTQYKKEYVEKEKPQLPPPVLEDEMSAHVNGHVEEKTTEISSSGSDTKVVTKTTTVTETQVITEISGKKPSETITAVNGNGSQDNFSHVKVEGKVEKVKEKKEEAPSSTTSPSPNKNGSAQEIGSGAEESKSPNKVKKQKSFKKTLMKKFKKDEK